MISLNIGILPVFLTIIGIGLTCLLLVASELGKRARMSVPGRIALMGALGFGVIAFSLKTGIILYLDSLSHEQMVAAHAPAPTPPPLPPATHEALPSPAKSWPVWRALPATAPAPANNPQSAAKITLGKALFFDTDLSADRTLSCASCHRLAEGGDDNSAVSSGIDNQKGNRNAPSVINAAFLSRLFWDGRAPSLEAQARGPLVNPVEMGMPSLAAVTSRVRAKPAYARAFRRVFGSGPVTISRITKAIAAYERTLITPQSPYDRFVAGERDALSPQQLRGMALFQEMGCRNCHLDPTFSSAGLVKPFGTYRTFPVFPDNKFVRKYDLLVGGEAQTWRVPSLRNVAVTGPYFHNGAVNELEEAIRVMAVSQLQKRLSDERADDMAITVVREPGARPGLRLTVTRNRAMSGQDIKDIAAFLRSLTSPVIAAR